MAKPLKRLRRSSVPPAWSSKTSLTKVPDQSGSLKSFSRISPAQVTDVSPLASQSAEPSDEAESRSLAPITSPNHELEKVGYGSPPKRNQFKKGQSGNPKGRQKGLKNPGTLWREHLSAKVRVVENGREMMKSKQELIVISTINKAVKGDHKATLEVLKQSGKYLTDEAVNSSPLDSVRPRQLSPIDKLILRQFHLEEFCSVTGDGHDEVGSVSQNLKDSESNDEGQP